MNSRVASLVLGFLLAAPFRTDGETVSDREGAVRGDRQNLLNSSRWIYNDIGEGFAEASRTGKPLMVVLRCVPCKACMGLDAEVLLENNELKPVMDQFVRLRLINANAIDLSRFQFDYDLSFTTLFFNGDGTLYGRYGSWEHQHDEQNRATASLRQALTGALAIHRGYPANKGALSGKQGERSAYATPIEMPTLKGKYLEDLNWSGNVVKSCVHCHMIGDGIRLEQRENGKGISTKWVYPYPAPASVGLQVDEENALLVSAVEPGTIAASAGLRSGDRLVSIAGQPLISAADISWVLHNAPDSGALPVVADRGGREIEGRLRFPEGWRLKVSNQRRVGTWPMRAMAFGGMLLEDLSDAERMKRGLDAKGMALLIKHVGRYGKHAAAMKAGFRKDDVIVEINGRTDRASESEMIGRMILGFQPGTKVATTVTRSGRKLRLKMPVQ
jgi:serine protease Do